MSPPDSITILGVRVDDVTYEETLARIEGFIQEDRPHQIVTVNPEFIVAAHSDAEFREILNAAALVLPDGVGVVWASRLSGQRRPLRERVAGSDLVPRIAALAEERGYRLFLLGAAPGVAEGAARRLYQQNPGLAIVGTHAGSPSPDEEDEIVALVRAARPHVLFVAYGAPAQDKWIARNLARLDVPVCMGVGGAFDFIAGVAVRAPLWAQRLGLEWLHRLGHEPWRWRRMLALPRFVWLVYKSWRA
jgi:N-acetylglucosaminyldiphosphoundecaprenol N-acetyl-beta-D-mannosaminyltransferase